MEVRRIYEGAVVSAAVAEEPIPGCSGSPPESHPPGILTGMATYSPLAELLQRRSGPSVELSFATIAEAVGGLPDSARRHRAWWANDPSHVQARAWLDAGWQVNDVRPDQGRVRFRRRGA